MKKSLMILLAIVMAFTFSVSVFAANEETLQSENATTATDIPVKVVTEVDEADVYYVDVEWTDMTFNYIVTKTWKPADHSYDYNGDWDGGNTATVTVTNHSNIAITATIDLTDEDDSSFESTIDKTSLDLNKGAEGNYGGADSKTATITVEPVKADSQLSEGTITIAKVKVTINKKG